MIGKSKEKMMFMTKKLDHMKQSMELPVACLTQFLTYLEEVKPAISSRKLFLGKKACYELSNQLPEYRHYEKASHTMEDYPLINLLFHFSKSMQLLQFDSTKKHYTAGNNAERFKKLPVPAKYCLLFLYTFTDYYADLGIQLSYQIEDNEPLSIYLSEFKYNYRQYSYLDFFQILEGIDKSLFQTAYEELPRKKKKYPFTALGNELFPLELYLNYQEEEDMTFEEMQEEEYQLLLKAFQIKVQDSESYFVKKLMKCTYVLQVSLDKSSWSFHVGSSCTLEDFHLAIQEAIGFDNDNLYYFSVDGKKYFHDACYDETQFASQCPLGVLSLHKNTTFTYLFDFGDCWNFQIKVKDILSEGKENHNIAFVEHIGDCLEQYPDWEEY